jgi:hypothetical protein
MLTRNIGHRATLFPIEAQAHQGWLSRSPGGSRLKTRSGLNTKDAGFKILTLLSASAATSCPATSSLCPGSSAAPFVDRRGSLSGGLPTVKRGPWAINDKAKVIRRT